MTWTTLVRVSGLVAWYFLMADVVVGTMAAGGTARVAVTQRRKLKLHGWFGWGLLFLVAVHITTIVASHYQGWGMNMVTEVGFGTVARNCGVIAAYLLVVVLGTALLKKFISRKVWVSLHHFIPFVILVLATVHGLLAGSDSYTLPIILPAVVALTLLGTVFIVRRYSTQVKVIKKRGNLPKDRRLLFSLPEGTHYRKK